jgi:hypothetical protein
MPPRRHPRANVRAVPYVKQEASPPSDTPLPQVDASPPSDTPQASPGASPPSVPLTLAKAETSPESDTPQVQANVSPPSDTKAPRERWPFNQSDAKRKAELRAEWEAGMYDLEKPSPLSDDVDGFGFYFWMITRLSRSYVGLYYRILEHIWKGTLTSRERAILHDRGFRKERPQDYPEPLPLIVEEEDIW